ncbi:MAG: hypothetical protein HC875_40360 [Anaerolineales bacterium]|nr:hypothetical protein [Anaerolineales bacterium]
MKMKIEYLLWLSLALALAGSLKHLAGIFASVDGSTVMGWLQAIAIDAGLFALAYSIRVRKVAKRSVKPLWFGVTVFTGISVYGNLSYGLLATDGNLPGWIVVSKPYVLAASLPILVLFLSELLSDDRQHASEQAEREAKKVSKVTGNTANLPETIGNLATVNAEKSAEKETKKAQLAGILATNPEATNSELASLLDVSRATVRNYKAELATNGNGKGVL